MRELDAEYIAWSMPKSPDDDSEPRGKAHRVRINMLALCSPDANVFDNVHRPVVLTGMPAYASSPQI